MSVPGRFGGGGGEIPLTDENDRMVVSLPSRNVRINSMSEPSVGNTWNHSVYAR